MSVYLLNGSFVRDTDMIRLDPDQLTIFRVRIIDAQIPLPLPSLQQQPQIRELCREGTWHVSECCVGCEIWYEPEEHEGNWNGVGREDEVSDRHFGAEPLACRSGLLQG